jgi:hypothetical protein
MKTQKTKVHIKRVNLSSLIEFHSPSAKGTFTRFTKVLELSATQNQEIVQIFAETNQKGLDRQKADLFLANLDTHLKGIQKHLPLVVKKKLTTLKKLQTDMGLVEQFKTSLPLISFVLGQNMANTDNITEGFDKSPFEKMWLDLRSDAVFNETSTRSWNDTGSRGIEKVAVRVVAGVTIYKTPEGNFQFTSGAAICVDGAPTAYAPNNGGQDITSSAGHNKGDVRTYKKDANGNTVPDTFYPTTDWWAVETDTGESDGQPVLKPNGYYISMSSYNYAGFPPKTHVQERYVNADVVSFAVISRVSMEALGLTIGDLVYVKNIYKGKNKGKWTGFLETRRADDRIGEISAAAADAIGVPSNPRNGGQDGDVEFTFYPNTAPNYRFSNDKEAAYYIFWNGKNIDEAKPVNRDLRMPK